ncbi:MAG: hypothetical protein MMC33_007862 [Icmadophila ericetorum]|nr:hypothetical protein [Icmadophila ericetorum]
MSARKLIGLSLAPSAFIWLLLRATTRPRDGKYKLYCPPQTCMDARSAWTLRGHPKNPPMAWYIPQVDFRGPMMPTFRGLGQIMIRPPPQKPGEPDEDGLIMSLQTVLTDETSMVSITASVLELDALGLVDIGIDSPVFHKISDRRCEMRQGINFDIVLPRLRMMLAKATTAVRQPGFLYVPGNKNSIHSTLNESSEAGLVVSEILDTVTLLTRTMITSSPLSPPAPNCLDSRPRVHSLRCVTKILESKLAQFAGSLDLTSIVWLRLPFLYFCARDR